MSVNFFLIRAQHILLFCCRLGKFGIGRKLRVVNLSGCVNITDATLARLAMAQHQSLAASGFSAALRILFAGNHEFSFGIAAIALV